MPPGLLAAALVLTQSIPLPGVHGAFNHSAADGPRHRVYVCASAQQTVEVVDTKTGQILKSIPGEKPSAVAYVADYDLLCVSRGAHVCLYDAESFNLIDTLDLPASADELRYDRRTRRLLVGLMTAPHEGIGFIDLNRRELVKEIACSHPQGFVPDPTDDRVFVCSPQENAISVLARGHPSVLTWALASAKSCFAVDLDAANQRLFVGCRSPAKLLVLNSATGAEIAVLPIGKDTDDLGYDPIHRQIDVFCGSGEISVIRQVDADHYQPLDAVVTSPGARNGGVIPERGQCYVTVPATASESASLRLYSVPQASPRPAVALVRTISLGAIQGRIDHFGYDPVGRRLFVAALGNNSVEVVDLVQGKVVRSIAGLTGPQGLLYLPEFHRLYVANGGDGSLRVYDGATFAPFASIPFGDDADNLRYDPEAKRIYVGYGAGAIGIVDPATNRIVGTIPLKAHPESFRLEAGSARVFINVPQAHALVTADRARHAVLSEAAPSAASNFPMAVDEANHRLFVGCRSPAKLLIFDTESGKEVAQLPLHRDCDDLFFGATRRTLFASCGEGFLDQFSVSDHGVTPAAATPTEPGARTCTLVMSSLYLAVPRHGDTPARLLEFR